MLNKRFSERLNQELDEMGVPHAALERIEVLSKLLKIPKFKAEALLQGVANLDQALLDNLTHELEVDAEWLLGKSDSKSEPH